MIRPRLAGVAGLTLATLFTSIITAGTAQAASSGGSPPPVNATERAVTLTRPAVVRLLAQFSAVVEDPTGTYLRTPVTFEVTEPTPFCTGFGVGPDGYVATAGHCVDTTTLEGNPGQLIQVAATQVVAADPTLKLDEVLAFAEKNWTVRGPKQGSPIDLTVFVATGSLEAGNRPKLHRAEIVGYRSASAGDVALLKIDVKDLPTVPLANDADLRIGSDVISIGFPARTDAITDPTLEPSNKDGRISSKKTTGGVPLFETSAALSPGMSGGPTVDLQGRLVGINSRVAGYDNEAFSFITTSDILSSFMASKGVRPAEGRVDTLFRTAVDAYYAGHYTDAVAEFDKLLAVSPGHPQATEVRLAAIGARERYGDVPRAQLGSGLPFGLTPLVFWSIVGGGGALVLLLAVLLAVRVRRRRKSLVAGALTLGAPAQHVGFGPQPFGVAIGSTPVGAHPTGPPVAVPPFAPTFVRHPMPPPMGPISATGSHLGHTPRLGTPLQRQPMPDPHTPSSGGLPAVALLAPPPSCSRCTTALPPVAAFCPGCGSPVHA